jgi:hypothetical protein
MGAMIMPSRKQKKKKELQKRLRIEHWKKLLKEEEERKERIRIEYNTKEKGNEKIFVFTSNKYMHLTRIYAYLFNEFWSPNREVTILGYDKPTFELPKNFEYVSLGKQVGGPENWSTPLREYIESLDCKHLIWSTEDLFIISPIAGLTRDIEITEKYVTLEEKPHGTYDIIMKGENEPFRIGGIWSLWNREYLLKYLKPGMTPWSFENQSEANYDGYKILGTRKNWMLHFCGSINSGDGYTNSDRINFLNKPLRFDDFYVRKKIVLDEKYILQLRELGYIDENNVALQD